ncbi:hypothetical protein CRUP_037598, partial [Coryphaenoides rupestris]
MSSEHTPLLGPGVCGLAVGMAAACGGAQDAEAPESGSTNSNAGKKESRKLDTFFGVMVPTILSMFSIVLFLRTGFVVGHAGLFHGLLMLLVAYTIISLTILSICAISTNGAIKGGGAYYMISRSLGPEFGGSIGLMFFLAKDYGFFQRINIWPPFVTIGIYCAALSAAMSSMIGASRILHALAVDQLFVQLGKSVGFGSVHLNTVAGLVTVFYLLAYAAVDLACLALEWASAPNFRPTFQLFSWHTCLLGMLSCLVMMFVINPVYSSASIIVRKYLLMLDVRKDHVKFWRPQVLLMVANPRSSAQLILFVNQLKKGGLFVLGHVQLGDL